MLTHQYHDRQEPPLASALLLLLLPLASCLSKPENRHASASLRDNAFSHARSLHSLKPPRPPRKATFFVFPSLLAFLGVLGVLGVR